MGIPPGPTKQLEGSEVCVGAFRSVQDPPHLMRTQFGGCKPSTQHDLLTLLSPKNVEPRSSRRVFVGMAFFYFHVRDGASLFEGHDG
jgi:hypothetical protein